MRKTPIHSALAVMIAGGLVAAAPKEPPDLTQGATVDRTLTYNLGATGLRGWIDTKPADFFESQQGRTTTASRQILVTHVGEKSPADGVMRVDDVILGAAGRPFTDDARKSIALAIQEAEKEANGGLLKLTRWRKGKTEEVQLKLRVMGTYSDTAPYDCPKSKRIFDEACRALIVQFDADCKAGGFPDDCNRMRVASVEEAITAIEAATEQPEMRSLRPPEGGLKKQDP